MASPDGNPEAATAATSEADPAATASPGERRTVLWLTNASHAVNHFQGGIMPTLYTAITATLHPGLRVGARWKGEQRLRLVEDDRFPEHYRC
jgi:hypothetical protein